MPTEMMKIIKLTDAGIANLYVFFVVALTDGEVESFRLVPISEVANIIRTTSFFKTNCNVVIIDFLIRHGYEFPFSINLLPAFLMSSAV